jgi:hypothetical protein
VNILVRHLAATQLQYYAERVYRLIFGTQITLLKWLNTSGVATRAQLVSFYEWGKQLWPDLYANYSFEAYLNFLVSHALVGTQDQEHYVITDSGKEFLRWMTSAGVPETKPF